MEQGLQGKVFKVQQGFKVQGLQGTTGLQGHRRSFILRCKINRLRQTYMGEGVHPAFVQGIQGVQGNKDLQGNTDIQGTT